jgi:peptidoglycan/xylan/chitin deacetylase (PgdA/CDA1 family)
MRGKSARLGVPLLVLAAVVRPTLAQEPRMVPVDGHSMHVRIVGPNHASTAHPVVVFESGAGTGLGVWTEVLNEVARFAHAVAYDRAGIGLSEPDGAPPTPRHVAERLHRLLARLEHLRASGYTADEAAKHIARVRERTAGYASSRTGPYRAEMEVILAHESGHAAEFRRLAPQRPIPVSVLMAGRYQPEIWSQRPCAPRDCHDRWLRFRRKWLEELVPEGAAGAVTIAARAGHEIQTEEPAVVVSAIRRVLAAALPPARAAARAVAVTFDDLPAGSAVAGDLASLRLLTERLLESVRRHGVPAVGFVNEGKLFAGGAAPAEVEGRTALLRMWLDAGLELGNHSYSHGDLNRMRLEEFQADVIRGEAVTRKLLEERGRKLRYFRHPFLHVGEELRKRRAFEGFLAAHGYTVAPVTVDNDEYVYAAVYADARRRGDAAAATRIGDEYLRYMDEVFSFFEDAARRIAGREIKHVLLLHANTLNADYFGALAEALGRRGYRFVPLAEALQDDVYRLPDTFVGAPGNSWLNHWEITAGRKPVRTPSPSDWILKASAALPR